MAKKPTIKNIGSGYSPFETITQNFKNIADAFENTVSRDGSTPNQMEADLDLNSNDLLNVGEINADGLILQGTDVTTLLHIDQDVIEAYETVVELAEETKEYASIAAGAVSEIIFKNKAEFDTADIPEHILRAGWASGPVTVFMSRTSGTAPWTPVAPVRPQHFGNGTAGWQVEINAAINYLSSKGGGNVLIENTGTTYTLRGPVVLLSDIELTFQGRPTLILASGINSNVIESKDYALAAAREFEGTENSIQRFSLTGRVYLDGNRAGNTTAPEHSGHGLAVFGRDFVLEDVYTRNTRRRGGSVTYTSGASGGSPYNGRIVTFTSDTTGEEGLWCNVSDVQVVQVNAASPSQNGNGAFSGVVFRRTVHGGNITVWRKGFHSNSHKYGLECHGLSHINQASLETGIVGNAYLVGNGHYNVTSYNLVGTTEDPGAHVRIAGRRITLNLLVNAGGFSNDNATAIHFSDPDGSGRNKISMVANGKLGKILDWTGSFSSGANDINVVYGYGSPTVATGIEGCVETDRYSMSYVELDASKSFSFIKDPCNGPVSAAGITQATAIASSTARVRGAVTRIFSSGSANTATVLPKARAGLSYVISNPNARDVLLFPDTGDTFYNLVADEPITIPMGTAVRVFSDINGRWFQL